MVPEPSCLVTVEIVTRVFLSGQLFCLCELEYIINLGGGARGLLSHRTVDSGGPFVYQLSSCFRHPIYRIPTSSTLCDLAACFLTFHSLSTSMHVEASGLQLVIALPTGPAFF